MKEIELRAKFRKLSNSKECWQKLLIMKNHITALDDMGGYTQITDWEQSTGIEDKNGVMAFEGDEIEINTPDREYQTHEGPNIPRPDGIYTEPLDPYIKKIKYIIIFKDGAFCLDRLEEPFNALKDNIYCHDHDTLMEHFQCEVDLFVEDLEYLLEEHGLKNEKELIDYVSGFEITGNIHKK